MYSKTPVVCAILGVNILSFMITSNVTWSSPILAKLMNPLTSPIGREIDTEEASWISSIITLSAILGTYIFNYLAEEIGQKMTMILIGIPILISNLIFTFATTVQLFYLGRFIVGFSLGSIGLLPIYVGELTYKNHRAFVASTISCSACIGVLFTNSIVPFVSIQTFSFICSAISVLCILFFVFLGQEVPHFYLRKDKEHLARLTLEKLRGGYEDIDEAFNEIYNQYIDQKKGKLRDIFKNKASKKAFLITSILIILQQFSGATALLFYGERFFRSLSTNLSPEACMIIISSSYFASSVFASILCIKFNKKTLLIISGTAMGLSEIVLSIYSYCDSVYQIPKSMMSIPLICLSLVIITYNIGIGPMPWVIVGEVFPSRIKALATSTVTCIFWIVTFIVSKYFVHVFELVGGHGFFAFSAFCCFVIVIFTKFYVIETKDKSLEEIQNELSK